MEYKKNKPIYIQLIEEYMVDIVNSNLLPGEKLKSVREVALEKQVNPNTVQRAFSEMEREGIIVVQRGVGSFLTDDLKKIENLKKIMITKEVNNFLEKMKSYGYTKEEVIKIMEEKNA